MKLEFLCFIVAELRFIVVLHLSLKFFEKENKLVKALSTKEKSQLNVF